jgi:hypothetical protein
MTAASGSMDEPPAERLSCSFCGKSQDEVRKLIAGQDVYICDECIDLCNDIIAQECESEDGGTATSAALVPVSACIVCRLPKEATDLLSVPDVGFVCCRCADTVRSVADAHLPSPSDVDDADASAVDGGVPIQTCRLCRLVVATVEVPGRGGICSGCMDAVVSTAKQRRRE